MRDGMRMKKYWGLTLTVLPENSVLSCEKCKRTCHWLY